MDLWGRMGGAAAGTTARGTARRVASWLLAAASVLTVVGAVGLAGQRSGEGLAAEGASRQEASARVVPSVLLVLPGVDGPMGYDLRLDGDGAGVRHVLGEPVRISEDIAGPLWTWELGAVELSIMVWEGTQQVAGIAASTVPGAPVGIYLPGGHQLGAASLDDVVRDWGQPTATAQPRGDFVAAWEVCAGRWPVVVKLDQNERAPDLPVDPSAPVTSVLIAYADAPPGSGPCLVETGQAHPGSAWRVRDAVRLHAIALRAGVGSDGRPAAAGPAGERRSRPAPR